MNTVIGSRWAMGGKHLMNGLTGLAEFTRIYYARSGTPSG